MRFRKSSLSSQQRFHDSLLEHQELVNSLVSGKALEAERINDIHLTLARD